MRMDKLTSRFQQALADAQSLAVGRDHPFIEPAHVLLALIDSQGGTVQPLLVKVGADVNRLRAGLGAALDRLPKVEGTPGEVHVSNERSPIRSSGRSGRTCPSARRSTCASPSTPSA